MAAGTMAPNFRTSACAAAHAWGSFVTSQPSASPAGAGAPSLGGRARVNNKPTYLSKDGLDKLRAELDEMLNVRRTEVAQRIHDAKEHGDLSENAEYEDAKNEQAFVEGRIQTLETMIKNATIIDETTSTDHVQIGSTVKVKGEDGVETFTSSAPPRRGRAMGGSRTSRRSAARCSAGARARRLS